MRIFSFESEAEECRRLAADYMGEPEGTFLLRLATSFEELATQSVGSGHLEPGRAGSKNDVDNP